MKAKKTLARLLWLFVAASVAAMIVNEMRAGSAPGDESGPDRVIVYSFHGDLRCSTCDAMEAGVEEAIKRHFTRQWIDGQVEWRKSNYQEDEQLRNDFDILTSTVVLSGIRHNRRVKWKHLNHAWPLAKDEDEETFIEYIRTELETFQRELDEGSY